MISAKQISVDLWNILKVGFMLFNKKFKLGKKFILKNKC
jgi:hypothetical protein